MEKFNLYYKGTRLNNSAISKKELERIVSLNRPIKKVSGDNVIDIPLNKIRVVKCTIV